MRTDEKQLNMCLGEFIGGVNRRQVDFRFEITTNYFRTQLKSVTLFYAHISTTLKLLLNVMGRLRHKKMERKIVPTFTRT
jgi:hypothetical protein